MHFNYVWLRDHCHSASCYNSKTNQRNLDTGSIDLKIRPKKTRVDEENLFLTCKSQNDFAEFISGHVFFYLNKATCFPLDITIFPFFLYIYLVLLPLLCKTPQYPLIIIVSVSRRCLMPYAHMFDMGKKPRGITLLSKDNALQVLKIWTLALMKELSKLLTRQSFQSPLEFPGDVKLNRLFSNHCILRWSLVSYFDQKTGRFLHFG